MSSNLSFITNEEGNILADRFSTLIKDSEFFDCLVGYFYSSGFHTLYESLENTKKIRILIGINTDKKTYDLIQESKNDLRYSLGLSSKEAIENFSLKVISEMDGCEDSSKVEEGIYKFLEWLNSDKIQIKVYPKSKIHAKVYISTFKNGDRDKGRIITGSSNFTKSGLVENLEFNVELRNDQDYQFALDKFNKLWEESVDVSDEYVQTTKEKTWLNDEITPYELYLKFLYEYLKEKINSDLDSGLNGTEYLPENFMDLKYQKDAVLDAKIKIQEYGGVFISDVVGLGKTYIATMLVKQLGGRTLVVGPPVLLDDRNPGSWPRAFGDFNLYCKCVSRGNLESAFDYDLNSFSNVIIDESHYFRNENTEMYDKLFQICSGKRIILVSATPLNNKPMDILAQLKLFQNIRNSTLPNPKIKNLEKFFKELDQQLKKINKKENPKEYLEQVRKNAKDIRENVLQYVMIRRTRSSVLKYYVEDLEKQGLKFPEVQDPVAAIYEFDSNLDSIFENSLEIITTKLTYARYAPLLDYIGKDIDSRIIQPQKNMVSFMKTVLLKRLESSFYAFKKSIGRFIVYYEKFIEGCKKGYVYTADKHIYKLLDCVESGDEVGLEKLLEREDCKRYPIEDFKKEFMVKLENDLKCLKYLKEMWDTVDTDPKMDKFIELLNNDPILSKNKSIIFTESEETAEYIKDRLTKEFGDCVLLYTGSSNKSLRKLVIENFDDKSPVKNNKYHILISTEVLSEGVNLHRSNAVLNYDIPWNPSRMMQRVGRIDRVDSKFEKLYIYNFFPASRINENIGLKEAAEAKINSFIEMLGNDAKLLTDEEVKSFDDLFSRLNSKELIVGEEEEDTELAYLMELRIIRDENKELFEKIKKLPKKARCGRLHDIYSDSLITFFKKGKLRKIYGAFPEGIKELDIFEAAEILKADKSTKKEKISKNYYSLLDKNKKELNKLFKEDTELKTVRIGKNENDLLKYIKAIKQMESRFTDEEEMYLNNVMDLINNGSITTKCAKNVVEGIKKITGSPDPFKIYHIIKKEVPSDLFNNLNFKSAAETDGPIEVILSEYLVRGE